MTQNFNVCLTSVTLNFTGKNIHLYRFKKKRKNEEVIYDNGLGCFYGL